MTGLALNIDKGDICIKVFHSMMIQVKDASERCRQGKSPNMKDVRGQHFLSASNY